MHLVDAIRGNDEDKRNKVLMTTFKHLHDDSVTRETRARRATSLVGKILVVPWEGVFRVLSYNTNSDRADVKNLVTGSEPRMRVPNHDQYIFARDKDALKFLEAWRKKVLDKRKGMMTENRHHEQALMERKHKSKSLRKARGMQLAELLAVIKKHDDYEIDMVDLRDQLNAASMSSESRERLFQKFRDANVKISDTLFVCPDCGEVEYCLSSSMTIDDVDVCENCIQNYYFSNYHGAYIDGSDARPYYDSTRSYNRENADDWYSVNCDYDATYHDGAYFDYDVYSELFEENEDEPDSDGLNDYHGAYRDFVERASDSRYVPLGVELEVYANDRGAAVRSLRDNFSDLYLERDGSLDGYHGFEIITQPLGKSEWAEYAPKLLDNLMGNKVLGYNHPDDNSYGIHISVNREYLSPLQEARMSLFLTAAENMDFVKVIAQRNAIYGGSSSIQFGAFDAISQKIRNIGGFQWSDSSSKKRKKICGMGKYSPLNLKSDIAECRIFQSTLHPQSFMKNLEFMWALVEWTNVGSATGSSWMHTDFIKWLAKRPNADSDFGNLIAYLRRPKYIVKRGNGAIDNTWLDLLPNATTKSQPTEEIEEEALAA
jgi:hypothetical protein